MWMVLDIQYVELNFSGTIQLPFTKLITLIKIIPHNYTLSSYTIVQTHEPRDTLLSHMTHSQRQRSVDSQMTSRTLTTTDTHHSDLLTHDPQRILVDANCPLI